MDSIVFILPYYFVTKRHFTICWLIIRISLSSSTCQDSYGCGTRLYRSRLCTLSGTASTGCTRSTTASRGRFSRSITYHEFSLHKWMDGTKVIILSLSQFACIKCICFFRHNQGRIKGLASVLKTCHSMRNIIIICPLYTRPLRNTKVLWVKVGITFGRCTRQDGRLYYLRQIWRSCLPSGGVSPSTPSCLWSSWSLWTN